MSCTSEGAMCYAYGCCETDGDERLAAEMIRYFSNFAASGNPNYGDQLSASTAAQSVSCSQCYKFSYQRAVH
jgi:hypothetical protein